MDIVLVAGALAICAIVAFSVVGVRRQNIAGQRSAADLKTTQAKGVLPVSLHPVINTDTCIGTGACIAACPEDGVIGLVEGQAKLVQPTACIGHGECLRACPVDAITLVIGSEKRGVDIPMVASNFETNVEGIFVVGELGGMGLIYNAMTQGLQCMQGIVGQRPKPIEGVRDVIVIGAGPAGMAASLTAMKAKLDFLTLDQDSVGGTVLHYPRHKVVMTRPVELPLYGPVKVSTVQKEALLEVWQDIIKKTGLEVRTETRVEAVTKTEQGIFEIKTAAETFKAQRVVLALGRRGSPRKLNVPGEAQGKVSYRLIEAEAYAGKHVLVVGGGDSAVEASIALGEAGATAHIAHRRKVFDRIKPKNQQRLDVAVEKGQVQLLLEANTQEIGEKTVTMKVGDEVQELDNDYVIVLAGGVLPTKFLEASGIEVRSFKGEAFGPANR